MGNKAKASDWKLDRHCFAETHVTDKGIVLVKVHVTEGEYTGHQLRQVIKKLEKAFDQSEKVRKTLGKT